MDYCVTLYNEINIKWIIDDNIVVIFLRFKKNCTDKCKGPIENKLLLQIFEQNGRKKLERETNCFFNFGWNKLYLYLCFKDFHIQKHH